MSPALQVRHGSAGGLPLVLLGAVPMAAGTAMGNGYASFSGPALVAARVLLIVTTGTDTRLDEELKKR